MDLLLALSSTLQSVELSFLFFLPDNGHYQSLLENMPSKLDWRERMVADRPKIVICVDYEPQVQEQPVYVSQEAEDFLYSEGENPFFEDLVSSGTGI